MSQKSIVYVLALFAGLCAATISFFAPFFPYGEDSPARPRLMLVNIVTKNKKS